MGLLFPVENGAITQGFGAPVPSVASREPEMWANLHDAWWNPYGSADHFLHYHAAIDISAPIGTPIVASEAGRVVQSYNDDIWGGGNKVRVEIRPGSFYTSNHMARRSVGEGAYVKRGQVLGEVGATGNVTGPHNHFEVGFDDEVGSSNWPRLYDARLFFFGGFLADDQRIKPLELPDTSTPPPHVKELPVRFKNETGHTLTVRAFKPLREGPSTNSKVLKRVGDKGKRLELWGSTRGESVGGSDRWYFGPVFSDGLWRAVFTPEVDTRNYK